MVKVFYLASIVAAIFLFFIKCGYDDRFSMDSNLSLTFSADTLRLDTVFSGISSPAKQFKIYNRNENSLIIESIELLNPSLSGFTMIVDGEKGTKLNNIEILKNDSLLGIIRINYVPKDGEHSLLVKDAIRLVVNGKSQYIYLEAFGQDVYVWKNKIIAESITLPNDKPYLVYDSVIIAANTTLNIQEGTQFYFHKGAGISVYGRLNAVGSIEHPIVFRGDRFDNIEDDIPYDNTPGQWNGFVFHPESFDNTLERVYIRNSVKALTFLASDPQKLKATLISSIVHNSSEYGILAVNSHIEAKNCLFSNSKDGVVRLSGGEYSFIHCTLANYFRWSPRQPYTLSIANYYGTKEYPLLRCNFINSIIYGAGSKELLIQNLPNTVANYQFINCLIKSTEIKDDHYVNTIWNKDPMFRNLNNDKIYDYDFQIVAESGAIDKADKAYSLSIPTDLDGNSRIEDSAPDIGCYEWINTDPEKK